MKQNKKIVLIFESNNSADWKINVTTTWFCNWFEKAHAKFCIIRQHFYHYWICLNKIISKFPRSNSSFWLYQKRFYFLRLCWYKRYNIINESNYSFMNEKILTRKYTLSPICIKKATLIHGSVIYVSFIFEAHDKTTNNK